MKTKFSPIRRVLFALVLTAIGGGQNNAAMWVLPQIEKVKVN